MTNITEPEQTLPVSQKLLNLKHVHQIRKRRKERTKEGRIRFSTHNGCCPLNSTITYYSLGKGHNLGKSLGQITALLISGCKIWDHLAKPGSYFSS